MIVDRQENISTIIHEKGAVKALVHSILQSYDTYKHDHIIINLTSLKTISLVDILEFLQLSNTHRKADKSFVVVSSTVDLDQMPDEIVVVPTLQEAYDIIEMEEIERDLGF